MTEVHIQSALVLLSGGLDSTTALALMRHEPTRRVEAVFVDYRQRHIREERSSIAVAEHYGVVWHRLDLRTWGEQMASTLTDLSREVPHGHYAAETMTQTVVPGRNATMLSAAAGLAVTRGLDLVVAAMHAGDHPIYPDCRPEFIHAMSAALEIGYGIVVLAPFLNETKAQIARTAAQLNAPVSLSWSCYEGGETHCGRCGTCVERAEAFSDAHLPDPTVYADPEFWKQAVGAH